MQDTDLAMVIQECADTFQSETREPVILSHEKIGEESLNDTKIIEEYISSRDTKELMIHLHNNSDFEKTSSVF